MKFPTAIVSAFCFLAGLFWFATSLAAQTTPPTTVKPAVKETGFTWTESFEGSGDSQGWITDLNSKLGYLFNKHFSVDMGVPFYFVQPSGSQTNRASFQDVGNPYVDLTITRKSDALDYSTILHGGIPIASETKGLSTGRATFDWMNHLDHDFGFVVAFLDLGVANSISDTRYFHRPYISLGKLAHFEAGPEFDFTDRLSATASGYYILPWGSQKVFRRGKKSKSGPLSGGPSLTRDAGANLGLDYNLSRYLDLSIGFSYSAYYVLNSFSFGVEFNIAALLRPRRGG